MEETLHAVKHYQRVLQRSEHDEARMLRCIEKLYLLPVTVQLLQDTGVGRTVNALRKGEGEVAMAARTVIAKWKQMVSDEEEKLEHAERAESRQSPPSPLPETAPSPSERISELSHQSSSARHERDRKSETNVSKMKDKYKKSSSSKRSEDNNVHHRDKRNDSSHSKKRRHDSESVHENSKSQRLAATSSSEDENESNDDNDEEESDDDDNHNEGQRSESDQNDYASEHETTIHNISSDNDSEHETPSSKTSHKASKSSSSTTSGNNKNKHSQDSERHKHKHKSDSNNGNSRHDSSHSKSSSRDRDKSKSKPHKDRYNYTTQFEDLHLKYERIKQAEKNEAAVDVNKQSSKGHTSEVNNVERSSHSSSRSRHSSTKEGHSNHSSKNHRESSKHHSHKSKHPDKEKSDSEKSKKSSSKHRDSHDKSASHDSSAKKDSKNSLESKKKDSKSEKHKDRHSSSKDASSSKSDSKSKTKDPSEYTPETKKRKTYAQPDEGIDGESGASFAEALGMISPSKSSISAKKKSSSSKISSESQPETSHKKQNSSEEKAPALLQSSAKLAPLAPLPVSVSALPDISPNYVPRPPPKLIESPFPPISEEEALTVVMNSKNQRTKVFSGNKSVHGNIPTLYDLCVFVLQEHINDLEYTGGIPYEIIKPIVDKASPEQLFTLEHYNPYLIEDTDPLWQLHCSKRFRNKNKQEFESWRDMYMRCCDEQEAKLKSLTANIKLSQDKSQPVRQTKMAYVDSIVKPPRNVARKQALHGTARKPVASPAARVAALANSTVFNASSAVGVGASSSTAPVRTSSFVKPKKAPLMQKALQLIKGRYKR